MTVQMYNSDQQNVDQENNSAIPTGEEQIQDSSHVDNIHQENKSIEMEQNDEPIIAVNDEQDKFSSRSIDNPQFDSSDQNSENLAEKSNLLNDNNAPKEAIVVPTKQFPETLLNELEAVLNNARWSINVIPAKEFEMLLDISLEMIRNGEYENENLCRHFVSDVVLQFFLKFYSDDIIENMKQNIFQCLIQISFKIVDLIVVTMDKDIISLLDLLSIIFSPLKKFSLAFYNDEFSEVYAKSRNEYGLIINLINYFGYIGGFESLLSRFKNNDLTLFLIFAYLKPFNLCTELLTSNTIETYFLPIIDIVPKYIHDLSDEELKKQIKVDSKCDNNISIIFKILNKFALRLPNDALKKLELLRLKVILRLLKISSFNIKMNALNELNQIVLNYSSDNHFPQNNDSLLTTENMALWLIENSVLEIVLKDCLHQPQYVEKLENLIRFLIKENTLSLDYLDQIWNAQAGKHEVIVKNVHDLIAKLALSFSSDQLDHLFVCFQSSWTSANKKEREKLLEMMRRLAKDDKDGSMAHKVLTLLWNLAFSDDSDIDIIDQALSAHLKILDYSRTCDKDSQRIMWLEKSIGQMQKSDCGNWVLPAMKHIREICLLYPESQIQIDSMNSTNNYNRQYKRRENTTYRAELLASLQSNYKFVALISTNLSSYMDKMRKICSDTNVQIDPNALSDGKRFSHCREVQERLDFLKFFLQEGQLWLCLQQANDIWNCLAQNAVFVSDRQICFRWFTSLMENESDLDPDIFLQFFETNVVKLDPILVDINGIDCFEKFFISVNCQMRKLLYQNHIYFMEDNDLIGLDYLWKLILFCEDDAANKAIKMLKDIYTNLGPKLINSQVALHYDFINTCFDRLKASYDTISIIENDSNETRTNLELVKMTRVLSVLYEYINKCDNDFIQERTLLPMSQSFRRKQLSISIKILNFGRNTEELELWTHMNETISSISRRILTKLKFTTNVDIEYLYKGAKIDLSTAKLVAHFPMVDKLNLSVRLIHSNTNISCSPDFEQNIAYNRYSVNEKLENTLPGVIMSKNAVYANFLFKLADIGMSMKYFPLREKCLSLLSLMPPDVNSVNFVKDLCKNSTNDEETIKQVELELFSSPTKTVYLLGIIYSLLLPTNHSQSNDSQDFQKSFIISKWGLRIVHYLNNNQTFLTNADKFCKMCAIFMILKISKFVLSTISYLKMFSLKSEVNLNEVLKQVPNDFIIRKISMNTAQNIYGISPDNLPEELDFTPNSELTFSVLLITWATATGSFEFLETNLSDLHQYFISELYESSEDRSDDEITKFDSYEACREAIEVLTIMLMLSPDVFSEMICNKTWQLFFIDLILVCNEGSIRNCILEQFTLLVTKCVPKQQVIKSFIDVLFKNLQDSVPQFFRKSSQFFQLFCNLLNFACQANCHIPTLNELLHYEFNLFKNARTYFYHCGQLEDTQLEGHLIISKELIGLLDYDSKYHIGCNPANSNFSNYESGLLEILLDQFLFTASKSLCLLKNDSSNIGEIDSICSNSQTFNAAYEFLVALCSGCVENLQHVNNVLENYLNNLMPITEWEYLPSMGIRPIESFVGLKNAGATCYMNSVLQQLFMIPEIREALLAVDTGEFSFDDNITNRDFRFNQTVNDENFGDKNNSNEDEKNYNVEILKQIQIIFGHLLLSKCQYYVPTGFWQSFRLFGCQINLREQHDALEFFNSLVDSLDEALKSLEQAPSMKNILGGTFADQKICKGCPHRYLREESFTTLNIDIRNHNSLIDSLEQYVKGDLLEGDNAYYCEKCDRKVDTIKRMCIKKLPNILAIQLKRFDYDFERRSAIKFNDYVDFPRILDMKPYTARGLAQYEGEVIEDDNSTLNEDSDISTQYELNGIIVHSGQASGGHYYSFILHKFNDGTKKWYKFDDGDVSDCNLEIDEEMKSQCFGGEYEGEVYDQMLKKMIMRSQKRWWNAYMLIYRKINSETLSTQINQNNKPPVIKMPMQIRNNVQRQNILFMHHRNLFSEEFYFFMKKLFLCNVKVLNDHSISEEKTEKIVYTTLNLEAKFLFSFCFRSKKNLRGSALEWYEALIPYLKTNSKIRFWFLEKHLINRPRLFSEFLLECPAADVRLAFSKIVVFLAHYALIEKNIEQLPNYPLILANRMMSIVLQLLQKEISDYSRNLFQYFNMFYLYATLGVEERRHLLSFNVPKLFIMLVSEEGYSPQIHYQYVEFVKLYQVVSLLIRCCDISEKNTSSHPGTSPLPNPYRHEDNNDYIMPLHPQLYEILFFKQKYVKKIIKDANTLEDTSRLLKFCCWENPSFSMTVLNEILTHISYAFTYELRPFFDLLHQILIINDSWEEQRIRIAFTGDDQNCNGLFNIIQQLSQRLEKRAYQCIKFLVSLFQSSEIAVQILKDSDDLKMKWINSVSWLKEELSTSYSSTQYNNYNNWSPITSNETSNSYALERSKSALLTLSKAEEVITFSPQSSLIDIPSVSNEEELLFVNNNSNNGDYEETVSNEVSNITIASDSNQDTFANSNGLSN